jgi:hypothetical protein
MRGRRPTMIGHAMADAPDDAGAAPGPGAPGYLRHVCHELRQPLVVDAANAIIDDLAAAANSAAAAPGQT